MSLLSQFVALPYLGLTISSDVLMWQKALAEVTLDGTNSGSASNPALNLKNAKTGVNNGGLIRWYAQNATPSSTLAATIKGQFAVNTAGAESGQIDFIVPKAGAAKTISLRGDLAAWVPGVSGEFALGDNTLRWSSVMIGDITSTYKGDFSTDGATAVLIQATSAHPLILKSNGNVGLRIETTGDVTHTAGKLIKGDFTNATHTSRTLFTTSTAASATYIGAAPTGTGAGFLSYGTSNAASSAYLHVGHDNTHAIIQSLQTGGASATDLQLKVGTNDPAVSLETNGDVRIGDTGGLITSSTAGFPYIPHVAGIASGTPTSRTGFVPFLYDSTNNKIGVYNGGAWKWTAALS